MRVPTGDRASSANTRNRGASVPAESDEAVFQSMLADIAEEEEIGHTRGAHVPADGMSQETPRDACLRRFLRRLAILVGDCVTRKIEVRS